MSKLHNTARRLHTHTVVFTDPDDVECAARALMGQSTKAIVNATGLSESQVQYRVSKAKINRWDFRHGKTPLSKKIVELGRGLAVRQVKFDIAPKWDGVAEK